MHFKMEKAMNPLKDSKQSSEKKLIYDKEMKCPNCIEYFTTKRTLTSRLRQVRYDVDGHRVYTPTSPLYYQTTVCPFCGMAYTDVLNQTIDNSQREKLMIYFSTIKNFSTLINERNINDAIKADLLALTIAESLDLPLTLRGAHLLKMSWLYEENCDKAGERGHLLKAKSALELAYEEEDFEKIGMSLGTIYNVLADINRKLDDYEAAAIWYNKLFSLDNEDLPKYVMEVARNNWEDFVAEKRKK